jgi:hypothetical protein
MSTATRQEYEQARAKLDSVLAQANSDPTYMAKLKADPRGTLQTAGLPDGAIGDFMREQGDADVSGYLFCWWTCVITSSKF